MRARAGKAAVGTAAIFISSAAALTAVACGAGQTPGGTTAAVHEVAAPVSAAGTARVSPADCPTPDAATDGQGEAVTGDPEARAAAQRALGFLGQEVSRWQEQHRCYGCHVQAVTLEAFVIGLDNGYDVPERHLDTVMTGMLDLPGGAHGPIGLSYHDSSLVEPSNAFGGAAFAHFDERIGPRVRDELIAAAGKLSELQQSDGSVGHYENGPVAVGTIQSTTQAMQTWRQAYARTADERWLTPLRRAEDWLQGRARQLADQDTAVDVQQYDYALIGLLSAGASTSEEVVRELAQRVRGMQQPDGSWGRALTTGETLHTLRMLGTADSDPAIRRGTRWLVSHQAEDGGWGHGGQSRAEAMWAVLGLVGINVASIDLAGIGDGQHVGGVISLNASATDNGGGGVQRVDLVLDDVLIHSACGASARHRFDTSGLEVGPHVLEVLAQTAGGQVSRRRVELFSGAYYLTGVSSRFEGGGTEFSLRNVAPVDLAGNIRLRIFRARERDGSHTRGERVHQGSRSSNQGAMSLTWNGQGEDGAALPRGRYVAELALLDDDGAELQTVEVPFVHDTAENRHAAFGRVEGSLGVTGGDEAENAQVELVDDDGNVVARTRATRSGQYRFEDVDVGRYRVRARRQGFRTVEAPVSASPAQDSTVDLAF